jgi:hypothetical protein
MEENQVVNWKGKNKLYKKTDLTPVLISHFYARGLASLSRVLVKGYLNQ